MCIGSLFPKQPSYAPPPAVNDDPVPPQLEAPTFGTKSKEKSESRSVSSKRDGLSGFRISSVRTPDSNLKKTSNGLTIGVTN